MTHRLVGVGVGPGDPDLVTVRAVRELRAAGVVLVPVTDPVAAGRAEATVLAHLDDAHRARVRRVEFSMADRRGVTPRRATAWEAAADVVIEAFDAGVPTVAFATIGDPNVYSTFSYLAQTVRARRPDTVTETVPGITAMQDLAARSGTPLCEGRESLALVPLTSGLEAYRAALETMDTVVAYKGGRQLPQVLAVLAETGRLADAVVGCEVGTPGERIIAAADWAAKIEESGDTMAASYLTTVIAPGNRSSRGGQL
jgi:precorrin-2/cobalt-factor-2 C20-methyltransferase